MKPIIDPISRELLLKELTPEHFIRYTNYGRREIYRLTALDCPMLMQEIGRLRELSFREAGGGTGKEVDIDEFDTCTVPYRQLIVWDPVEQDIIGGYRYLEGGAVPVIDGVPQIATAELFRFSNTFLNQYFPNTIELGRSFVQPKYQSSTDLRKGLFSLDNLWDGLGALVDTYDELQYFFGKVTMYPSYNVTARDYLLGFLRLYFKDPETLVTPIESVELRVPMSEIETYYKDLDLEQAFKACNKKVREHGENIPPLISAYIKLSPTTKIFGTAINGHFGSVEETGILIKIEDIYHEKKVRHIQKLQTDKL